MSRKALFLLIVIGLLVGSLALWKKSSSGKTFHNSPALAQSASDWPQLAHDAQHTARTTVEVTPSYKLTWGWMDKDHIVRDFVSEAGASITDSFTPFTAEVIFAEHMQPIIAEGKVFFGAMNGSFYAVDALDGHNLWDYQSGGAILSTAVYNNGVVVFGSMDGKLYGLNTSDGSLRWQYQTGAGINAAPVVQDNTIYIGSRDGYLYAFDVSSGSKKWQRQTWVPNEPQSAFTGAPIVAPAVVSEDGATVLFGAENMYFYAVEAASGNPKWAKKLIGQSFLHGWPVIKGDKVVVRTMSSLYGAEEGIGDCIEREVLDNLSADPDWLSEEKPAILNWLNQHPLQKTMYVFNINTGQEPYQVAMGRVTGSNLTAHPPAIDSQGRMLTYWRIKNASFLSNQLNACFGTSFCPDISAIDLNTGDRIKLNNPSSSRFDAELDNGFPLSIGGGYLYLHQSFRGAHSIRFADGRHTRITTQMAKWDCANWRAWGVDIIYYGNDEMPDCTKEDNDPRPPKIYQQTYGFSGVAIAETNGRKLLYINEARAGLIAAIEHE